MTDIAWIEPGEMTADVPLDRDGRPVFDGWPTLDRNEPIEGATLHQHVPGFDIDARNVQALIEGFKRAYGADPAELTPWQISKMMEYDG